MKTNAKTKSAKPAPPVPKVGPRLAEPEKEDRQARGKERGEREIAVTIWLTPEQHAFLSLRSYAMTGVNGGRAAKGMGLKGLCTGIVRDGVDRMMAAARRKER